MAVAGSDHPHDENAGADFATEVVDVDPDLLAESRRTDAEAELAAPTEHERKAVLAQDLALDPPVSSPSAPRGTLPPLPMAPGTDAVRDEQFDSRPTMLGDVTAQPAPDSDRPSDPPQQPGARSIGVNISSTIDDSDEYTLRDSAAHLADAGSLIDDLVPPVAVLTSAPPEAHPIDEAHALWNESTALDEDDQPTISRRDSDIADATVRQVSLPDLMARGLVNTNQQLVEQLMAVKHTDGVPFGPYTLIGTIGTGGMAEVRLALDERPGHAPRACVIKRISKQHLGRDDYTQMFKAEARIGHMLDHPNIVALYDDGDLDGTPYIAFELVDGITAAHVEKLRDSRVPPSVVIELGIAVARGLGYAHSLCAADGTPMSLVHRDVSPQNILISRNGEVKLADFGIARFEGREHETRVGLIKGKMRYLAPEQIRMERLDARTDLFSLGVVLAELLSGEPLFPGSVFVVDNAAKQIRDALAPPRSNTPADLIALLVKLTAERRDARPDYAESVMRTLRAIHQTIEDPISLADYCEQHFFRRLPSVRERALAREKRGSLPSQWIHATPTGGSDEQTPRVTEAPTPKMEAEPAEAEEGHYPTSIGVLFPELFGSRVGAFTGAGSLPELLHSEAPPALTPSGERRRAPTVAGRKKASDPIPVRIEVADAVPVAPPLVAPPTPAARAAPQSVELVRPVASGELGPAPSTSHLVEAPRSKAENLVILAAVVVLMIAAVVVFIDYMGL